MKPSSSKNKGRRFENYIASQMEKMGLGRVTRTPGSGSGQDTGDILNNHGFSLECKNRKKSTMQWWKSIDQTKKAAERGKQHSDNWGLIVRDPRTPEGNPKTYVVLDFWRFLKFLKNGEPQKARAIGEKISVKADLLGRRAEYGGKRGQEDSFLVYICHPYRAKDMKGVKENFRSVKRYAKQAHKLGFTPIVPHINSAHIFGMTGGDDHDITQYDFALLSVCDLMWVCGDDTSGGMKKEISYCHHHDIPVFYDGYEEGFPGV